MVKKAAILVLLSIFCASAFGMQFAGSGAPVKAEKVEITIGEPEYEWWLANPKAVTVKNSGDVVFDLKVPRNVGEAVIEFHIGVIDMGTDIGVVGNHEWFAAGLPDTLRSVGYGDEKASRLSGELKAKLTAGPMMLAKGEYRVYVCAYDDSVEDVSVAKLRRDHLIGVGMVKLVVKESPVVKTRMIEIESQDGPVLGVLDMGSGKLMSVDTDEEQPSKFTKMGKGDICYADNGIGVLRGGRLYNINEAGQKVLLSVDEREDEDASFYNNPGNKFYVQTGNGGCYAVTVKNESGEAIDIEYSPVVKSQRLPKVKVAKEVPAMVGETRGGGSVDTVEVVAMAVEAVETAVVDAEEERRIFLPDLDDSSKNMAVVLDLATNTLFKLPSKADQLKKVDEYNSFAGLGKGDMAYDGQIGILRRGVMHLYNNNIPVEMEVDAIVGDVTIYKERLKENACVLIKTGDKREFVVTILDRRDGGVELAFHEKK